MPGLDDCKDTVSPNLINRFNTIPIKISQLIFVKIVRLVRKFKWKYEAPRITEAILTKEEKTWRTYVGRY